VEDVPPFEYLLDILAAFSMALFLHPNLYWFPKCIPFLGLGETRYCPDFPVRKLTGFKAGLLRDWEGKLERFNRSRSVSADYYLDSLGPASELYYMRGYPYNRFPVLLRGPESKARVRRRRPVGISRCTDPGPSDPGIGRYDRCLVGMTARKRSPRRSSRFRPMFC
jgi:hypothetical protein